MTTTLILSEMTLADARAWVASPGSLARLTSERAQAKIARLNPRPTKGPAA